MRISVARLFHTFFCCMIVALTGCTSQKRLFFDDREWYIYSHHGYIIDRDSIYRMSLGVSDIPKNITIISCMDSVIKYPGMKEFIADVLHAAQLDGGSILFYAPHASVMFVKPTRPMKSVRPSSLTASMNDTTPYTMWTYEEYPEDWNRDSTEMFTYTYFSKDKKRLLAVDWFDYGSEPMAQIMVWQSRDKRSSGMKLPWIGTDGFDPHDLKHITSDIEYWAHQLEVRRKTAIENYKIGQEYKSIKK